MWFTNGFSVGVLVLSEVLLNNPAKVVEWGSKLFVRQTPKQVSAGLKPRCRGSAVAPIQ